MQQAGGVSFGSNFLLFSNKSRAATLIVAGENPPPPALNDSPDLMCSSMLLLKHVVYLK